MSESLKSEPNRPEGRQSSRWDIRNAPKNYIALIATQAVGSLMSFASVLLITRQIGSEGYGGIVAVIAASQIAQILVNWTAVSVAKFGVEEFIDSEKIAKTFWLRFFVLTANALILLSLAPFWLAILGGWLNVASDLYTFVLLHFGISALWIHIQMAMQGVKLIRQQGVLMMGERIVIFFSLLALTYFGNFSLHNAVLCYIAGPAAAMVIGMFLLRRYVFAKFTPDRGLIKDLIKFSAPILPYYLVGLFSTGAIDAIFISKLVSTRDLGVYAVASQVAGIALQLPTLANTLLLPFFVSLLKERRDEMLKPYFAHILPLATLSWGLLSSLMAAVASFLVPLVFGAEFLGSVVPMWILLSNSTLHIPILLGYGSLSNASSLTYIALVGAVASSIVNLTLNFLLIPVLGIEGSAWATSMLYLSSSLTFAILLRKELGIVISWTFLAIVPAFFGAFLFSFGLGPIFALTVCILCTAALLWSKAESLRAAMEKITQFRSYTRTG